MSVDKDLSDDTLSLQRENRSTRSPYLPYPCCLWLMGYVWLSHKDIVTCIFPGNPYMFIPCTLLCVFSCHNHKLTNHWFHFSCNVHVYRFCILESTNVSAIKKIKKN